ncbi:MAG: hypothetical protein ACTSUE_22880 [Promethearchaeota archaeon]
MASSVVFTNEMIHRQSIVDRPLLNETFRTLMSNCSFEAIRDSLDGLGQWRNGKVFAPDYRYDNKSFLQIAMESIYEPRDLVKFLIELESRMSVNVNVSDPNQNLLFQRLVFIMDYALCDIRDERVLFDYLISTGLGDPNQTLDYRKGDTVDLVFANEGGYYEDDRYDDLECKVTVPHDSPTVRDMYLVMAQFCHENQIYVPALKNPSSPTQNPFEIVAPYFL